MTKSTTAVILTSPARLAPWGDDGWRFTGAVQLVADGPDWLYARWAVPGEAEDGSGMPLVSMVLRDDPGERAADIAVMALALLQVPGWSSLERWWDGMDKRPALQADLERVAATVDGELKLAVMETRPGAVPDGVVAGLEQLGFEVVRYREVQ